VPSIRLPAQEVPSEQAAETGPEEDFLSEGLMKAMADAEEKSQQAEPVQEPTPVQTEPLTTPVLPVPQPSDEAATEPNQTDAVQPMPSEEDQLKALQAFIEQVQQEEQAQTQEQTQAETMAAKQDAQPSQVTKRIDELQAQLAQLRQQITESEAQPAAVKMQPQTKAAQPQETAAPVAKAQESKVQAAEPVQIPPQIAEKELETVVDLPQEVNWRPLVDLVGKQLGLNYMYDPTILKGQKVQLKIHGGKIKSRIPMPCLNRDAV